MDEEDFERLSKRLVSVSELADASYDILKRINSYNKAGDIELSPTTAMTIESWIKQYTILAVETQKDNNNPTIH
jgi:hypothetical protein